MLVESDEAAFLDGADDHLDAILGARATGQLQLAVVLIRPECRQRVEGLGVVEREAALPMVGCLRGDHLHDAVPVFEGFLDATCEEVDACLTILGDFLAYHLERPLRAWRALLEAPAEDA